MNLREHVRALHPRIKPVPLNEAALIRAHKIDHHRYRCNHTHAGDNAGPAQRPRGWTGGEDVVMRDGGAR